SDGSGLTTTRRTSPAPSRSGPVRTVSSTSRFAVPTSSGAGPHSGSTGRPDPSRITSPARTSTPGPASGLRAAGADVSGGSTRTTPQPSSPRSRSAPSRPGRPDQSPPPPPDTYACDVPSSPLTSHNT